MILALISSPLKTLALVAGFAAPVDLGSSAGHAPNFLVTGGGYMAMGRIDVKNKRVRLNWHHYPNEDLTGTMDCGGLQYVAVTSTPMLIDFMTDSRAFYVGREKDGSIVYEVWEIGQPTIQLDSVGRHDHLTYKPLKSRTVLRGLQTHGLGAPHSCINNLGLANGVLVKFVKSPAVFGLTWKASGAASVIEIVGPKDSPLLKDNLRFIAGSQHKTIGNIYRLIPWDTRSMRRGAPVVLLIDEDCNGAIDRIVLYGDRDLVALGYWDNSLWLVKLGMTVVHETPLTRKK